MQIKKKKNETSVDLLKFVKLRTQIYMYVKLKWSNKTAY